MKHSTYHLVAACGTQFEVDLDVWVKGLHINWYLKAGYPCRYTDKGEVYLHRELCDFPIGHVHHRDGNPLNCQRSNLQVVSPAEHVHIHERGNQTRQRVHKAAARSSSGYKGVCWHKGLKRWSAQCVFEGRNRTLGYFDDAEEAALAYDAAVVTERGPGAYTNLIPND